MGTTWSPGTKRCIDELRLRLHSNKNFFTTKSLKFDTKTEKQLQVRVEKKLLMKQCLKDDTQTDQWL